MIPWPDTPPSEHGRIGGPRSEDVAFAMVLTAVLPPLAVLLGFIDITTFDEDGASSGYHALGQMKFTVGIVLSVFYFVVLVAALLFL